MTIQIILKKHSIHSHFSGMYDERYRTPMYAYCSYWFGEFHDWRPCRKFARISKKKEENDKKIEKKCVILRHNIAFVLKSILCIINIVDCIVRGYIINIWYAWGNYRKTARNKTIVRYPSRERDEKKWEREREEKSRSHSTMIFFHSWSVPNFFNRIIETSWFF